MMDPATLEEIDSFALSFFFLSEFLEIKNTPRFFFFFLLNFNDIFEYGISRSFFFFFFLVERIDSEGTSWLKSWRAKISTEVYLLCYNLRVAQDVM